jgi:hypothetical protein
MGRNERGRGAIEYLDQEQPQVYSRTNAVEKANRRTWEVATLLALRGRLRAGDIWVEGSRQWRSVEDQLIKPALFPKTCAMPVRCRLPCLKQPILDVRAAVLNDTLDDAFRGRYPRFRPTNDEEAITAAA